jgi:hypothetical protein
MIRRVTEGSRKSFLGDVFGTHSKSTPHHDHSDQLVSPDFLPAGRLVGFIKATRRPWIAVGIPALAVVALAMHTDWDSMPWHRAAPNSYYLLEVLIRGLLVWAIGIFLAIWFYRRRDARRSAPR